MNPVNPIVGEWYLSRNTGRMFEVVSVDDDGTIELQDYDGNLDEFDRGAWLAQDVETIDPPEDLAGVFDMEAPDEADGGDALFSTGS
jgi:hypothetical protein